jgi:hypothetical protein
MYYVLSVRRNPASLFRGVPSINETTEALCERARELSPSERLDPVDQILSILNGADPAIDRLWSPEVEERLAVYRLGTIRAISLSDVLAKCGRA